MTNGREERFIRWKLDCFTEMIDRFEEAVSNEVNHKLENRKDYTNILVNIAGKAIMTSREIICLLLYGMPDGALALARNLYEQSIILGFFELHKTDTNFADIVEDFYSDNEVARIRPLLWYANNSGKLNEAKRLNDELNRAKEKAHSQKKSDYWWSGKSSFADIQIEVADSFGGGEFSSLLHLLYKRACITLHASCLGNNIRLGSDSGFCCIDNSPKSAGLAMPLFFSASCLIPIIGVVLYHFNLDYQELVKNSNELAKYYYTELEKELVLANKE